MNDLLRRPLTEITALLARRELSPVELMQATLDRIDAVNGKLNAFVAMRDRDALLADAREAEARIQRREARPLEGVPLGVKDLEDAAGLVTTHGSRVFKDNLVARDSLQVERLRAAGAIVVGKTNAPEFGATAITKNLLFGETRNPWNLERTPGGSSGGSSAAIAGSMIPLATASDGGGSVRIPATFTGCFGLKTSYGRIPHGPDRALGDGRHGGPRPAHAHRRGRGAAPGSHGGRASARSELAAASRHLVSRSCCRALPRRTARRLRRRSRLRGRAVGRGRRGGRSGARLRAARASRRVRAAAARPSRVATGA